MAYNDDHLQRQRAEDRQRWDERQVQMKRDLDAGQKLGSNYSESGSFLDSQNVTRNLSGLSSSDIQRIDLEMALPKRSNANGDAATEMTEKPGGNLSVEKEQKNPLVDSALTKNGTRNSIYSLNMLES